MGALASENLAFGEISKFSQFWEICPAEHLKLNEKFENPRFYHIKPVLC